MTTSALSSTLFTKPPGKELRPPIASPVLRMPNLDEMAKSGVTNTGVPTFAKTFGRITRNIILFQIVTIPVVTVECRYKCWTSFSQVKMGKKIVMIPANEVDLIKVKYDPGAIEAPDLSGIWLRLFVMLVEMPLIGPVIVSYLKKKNKIQEMLRDTVIPEPPMFRPEFPPQEQESGVVCFNEDEKSQDRVESAFACLPHYDPATRWHSEINTPFRYWKICDYAYSYRSKITTPSMVAEYVISAIEESSNVKPPTPLLISFDAADLRKQAAASTHRFEEGKPLSALDGIFVAIKDDIDCYPHPSNGGTTWFHKVHRVEKDAVCVSRLRSCGVIFVGKANMHEYGQGTTGNNVNNGTTRNPHNPERYTGGSSSGSAAIVASGICSAALGTDCGGSVRIPSSLCGVVGLKTTYGRIDLRGVLCEWGTVETIGPIASSVEDIMMMYAAILGASPADKLSLRPSLSNLPDLSSHEYSTILESVRLGKYTEWFNDVLSTDISTKCANILNLLSETHGCKIVEVVIPELQQIRTSHLVSVGAESLASLQPHCHNGNDKKLTLDTRTNLALFRSFTGSDYVAAQRLRRRAMYYHMEVFKMVDVIVTPTTGMTAPVIRRSSLTTGETNMKVTGNLMRFILAGNLLGLPAISVPVGYDKQGLPIGLQIIGRPWEEATILRLAAAFEVLIS
uniref:fatty acid amide hydrolase-like n=1 Tax=Erigeron canadensis TaxID=72917 RepID=UPI001CB8AD30|nr:fatty acid amide hydrolase-like [Erigeron canadensis]